jgi:preprotein translocase subunit SecD
MAGSTGAPQFRVLECTDDATGSKIEIAVPTSETAFVDLIRRQFKLSQETVVHFFVNEGRCISDAATILNAAKDNDRTPFTVKFSGGNEMKKVKKGRAQKVCRDQDGNVVFDQVTNKPVIDMANSKVGQNKENQLTSSQLSFLHMAAGARARKDPITGGGGVEYCVD